MIATLVLSFLAGVLTSLAPCVLPLLPVILGGSFDPQTRNKKRPFIIVGSLALSLIIFTLLLKASTVLIGINPKVWSYVSGGLVIGLGITMLFPMLWPRLIAKLGVEHKSQSLLGKAFQQKGTASAVLVGAALGPVFSSCSPMYAWVIATVLPKSAALGMLYLSTYILGVSVSLLAIALVGGKYLAKVKWASKPNGWFTKLVALLFIVVGFMVVSGYDKKLQTYLVENDFLGIKSIESKLVPDSTSKKDSVQTSKKRYNIDPYKAPEINGIAAWVNSDPITLEKLKGKVVLIDFWTYSCINCQRTQPFLNAWYQKYKNSGFEIIGMHAPEFAFEKVTKNVQGAVESANIKYPVALDNDFSTWKAYDNQYWPAKYLIDKDGIVRYTHFGEGDYDKTEKIIQELLAEAGNNVDYSLEAPDANSRSSRGQTPETYLGYARADRFLNTAEFIADKSVKYSLLSDVRKHEWSLGGEWQIGGESAQSMEDGTKLQLHYAAKEVYLVMSGQPGSTVQVAVEGQAQAGGADVSDGKVIIDGARLYKIVKTEDFREGKVTLTFPAGVTINAFTFGG